MSSVETGRMSTVETGQMPAAETGQVSAVETRQMTAAETSVLSQQCPRLLLAAAGCHGPKSCQKASGFCVFELATPYSVREGRRSVSPSIDFLQQLLTLELREFTPGPLSLTLSTRPPGHPFPPIRHFYGHGPGQPGP